MLCVGGVHELKLTFFMLKLCTVWSLRSTCGYFLRLYFIARDVFHLYFITPLDKSTAVAP